MSVGAFIVGCGRIAGGFNNSDESVVLTHVVAYRRLGVRVVGCSDVEAERAGAFASRWGIATAGVALEGLLKETQPEVVSVCSPAVGRLETLEVVLKCPSVRSVLLEKPVAATAEEGSRVLRLARESGKAVLVNFFRAFDPFYERLELECREGRLGRLGSGSLRYYGSAAVNASHGLERLLGMFGSARGVRRLDEAGEAPLFEVEFREGRVTCLPTSGCEYSPFELDLLFERVRVRVVDSENRVEYFESEPDPRFAGYFNLAPGRWKVDCVPSHESILLAVQAGVEAAKSGEVGMTGLLERSVEVVKMIEEMGERNDGSG